MRSTDIRHVTCWTDAVERPAQAHRNSARTTTGQHLIVPSFHKRNTKRMKLSAAATLAFAASASAFTTPAARSAIVSQKGKSSQIRFLRSFDSIQRLFFGVDGWDCWQCIRSKSESRRCFVPVLIQIYGYIVSRRPSCHLVMHSMQSSPISRSSTISHHCICMMAMATFMCMR